MKKILLIGAAQVVDESKSLYVKLKDMSRMTSLVDSMVSINGASSRLGAVQTQSLLGFFIGHLNR